MRKVLTFSFLILVACSLGIIFPSKASRHSVPDYVFKEPAKVIRIIDGDTFVARWETGYQVKIRPASVGAPEVGRCFAKKATDYARRLLLNRWVWLSQVEKLWSYDRILAQVYLDSKQTANFGRIMVSQGFAEAMEEYPTGKKLQPLEDEAKDAKRGLWGKCRSQPTKCSCTGPDLDCGDFNSWKEAQSCYEHCKSLGYGDVYRLDGDNDGVACESLK